MKNEKPIFSIITICYNSEKTIEKTINSVLNQRKELYEYIIVDGKSTDNTLQIIEKYNENKYIKVVSEEDTGIYNAMNKGVKIAQGKWLIFLNSDDWFEKNILEKINLKYPYLLNENSVDAFYGDINKININGEFVRTDKPFDNLEKQVKRGMPIFHQATFIKRDVYEKLCGFDEKFKIAGDWEFILRMIKNKCKFEYIPLVISNFRWGGVSSKSHIVERHMVRKKNKIYTVVDIEMYREILVLIKKFLVKIFKIN